MKQIQLTKGKVALVDDADFLTLSQYRWYANRQRNGKWYALGSVDGRKVYMHRLLMNFPTSLVDHKNGDGLDNRRGNLREATRGQNLVNAAARPGRGGNRTSRFKGVSRPSGGKKWIAQITVENKVRYLGSFLEEHEAALAYNDAAFSVWGEFAQLNVLRRERRVRPCVGVCD